MKTENIFLKFAPLFFVLIWSTGWIVGKFASLVGEPLSFLAWRFFFAILVMGLILIFMRVPVKVSKRILFHALISGVLIHTIYLGGVWWAIAHGIPTPVSGVIAAVQPILTAILAPLLLSEKLTLKQMIGVFIGFTGILIVLSPKLAGVSDLSSVIYPLVINLIAMVSVTFGTIYQKKYLQGIDLRTGAFWQYIGALLVILPFAFAFESFAITWNMTAVLTLLWSVLMLSIGAVGLLLYLIQKGEVSRSAMLIFLIPPTTALEAWLIFGEGLSPLQIGGMVITALGVYLATRK
jgi:drug/metabolite transporter (DMT)-like permease